MYELIDTVSTWLPGYMLTFSRISAMVLSMPVLGYSTVSPRIRILMAMLFTIVIAPMIGAQQFPQITSLLMFAVGIAREILIGLIIGFGARMIFEGFTMAGSFIGLQMGFAIMQVMDPSSNVRQPIISQFFLMVIVIFFLITDSHYFLIQTLYENFKIVQLGEGVFRPLVGEKLIEGGSMIYQLAVRFAAPAMIFLLLIDISLAFLARVMPQMNIFFVGLPLKVGMGIFTIIISLKIFQGLFGFIYDQMQTYVFTLVHGIGSL